MQEQEFPVLGGKGIILPKPKDNNGIFVPKEYH